MSKTKWEYHPVEKTFCQQLKAMSWQWIVGDNSLPSGQIDAPVRK